MWTDKQFWRDSTWRAFRTFCQSLAGLLTVQQVSTNMNAPWLTLIYASGVAGLISLLQSIDRERVAVATSSKTAAPATEPYNGHAYSEVVEDPAPTVPLPAQPDAGNTQPVFGFITTTTHGCGESLR